MNRLENLKFNFPIPRTHCGMAMGNGNLGALIWGRNRLHITVNRADFWDHRNGECLLEGTTYEKLKKAYDPLDRSKMHAAFVRKPRVPETLVPSRLPVGRFEFKLKDDIKLKACNLEYKTGDVQITVDRDEEEFDLTLVMGLDRNILLLKDPGNVIDKVYFISSWEWDVVVEKLKGFGFKEPEKINNENLTACLQACPDDPSLASVCRKNDHDYIICLERGENNQAALANSNTSIDSLLSDGIDEFVMKVNNWWKEYWENVPKISLPDDFFNKFIKYAFYKFACATHPYSSIPSGIQGPWIEEYQPAKWSGDYHFNVNIQQIYTLTFPTGNFKHLLPLFDMLESEKFHKVIKNNSKVLFGIDDGLLITHAVNDYGYQCGGISGGSVLDQAVTGWTAQLYWLYYKYTLDKEFLRKRAYPFIYGAMRNYEEMLEEDNGRLSIPINNSAEYGVNFINKDGTRAQNIGKNPSYQIACMHMLVDALLEASEILDLPPRPIWKKIKEEVPPYTVYEENKQKRIAIWEGQDLDVCHRHHSHLSCIYPFDTLKNWHEHMEIIDNSIDHWILKGMGQWSEWCIPWATIIQSRMGFKEAPRIMMEMWKEVFINENLTTVYLPRFRGLTAHRRDDMLKPKETHEIMQLDGTMGGATAFIEMLVHSNGNSIYIFPAVSEKWQDVSFENVRVPGAFIINGIRENGNTKEVGIKSLKGGKIKIIVADREEMKLQRNETQEKINFPAEIEMKEAENILLTV